MKGLALETIVRWIILSVVAVVVIGLVIFFSDDIKRIIGDWFNRKDNKTEIVEADSFSTSQVVTYIKSCWGKTGEKFDDDMVCYILKGDVNGVDVGLLSGSLDPPAQVNTEGFETDKDTTIIRFVNLGNIVYVES